MNDLRCIVYVSSAVSLFSDDALEALLLDARDFNQEAGVSGVLLYTGGSFFQYFEGPPDGVARVYERIMGSRRHSSVRKLLDIPISERLFPDWLMGISHATDSTLLRLQGAHWGGWLGEASGLPPSTNPGLALLRTYWEDNQDVG